MPEAWKRNMIVSFDKRLDEILAPFPCAKFEVPPVGRVVYWYQACGNELAVSMERFAAQSQDIQGLCSMTREPMHTSRVPAEDGDISHSEAW